MQANSRFCTNSSGQNPDYEGIEGEKPHRKVEDMEAQETALVRLVGETDMTLNTTVR